jgi:hypothetical protein
LFYLEQHQVLIIQNEQKIKRKRKYINKKTSDNHNMKSTSKEKNNKKDKKGKDTKIIHNFNFDVITAPCGALG